MSRNLNRVTCERCGCAVKIVGKQYSLPLDHPYCPNLVVADAMCFVCNALYTAWCSPASRPDDRVLVERYGFFDLSFRSTFNDEPGEGDLPEIGTLTVARVVLIDGRVVAWATEEDR